MRRERIVIAVRRPVRFEEVDAAGILFFAHFFAYAHEAMERLFDAADGGYVGLVTERVIGFPAVKASADFAAPLCYGDVCRIEAKVARLGKRSLDLAYRFLREPDGVLCAQIAHTVVCTDLRARKSCDMPPDVRAALAGQR